METSDPHLAGSDQLSGNSPDDIMFEQYAGSAAFVEDAPLPTQWRCNTFIGQARMQGRRSTCAAFVGAIVAQSVMQKRIMLQEDIYLATDLMSPEFIYYHRANRPSPGMCGRDVFRILRDHGSVPESVYPYRESQSSGPAERDDVIPPGPELYSRAKQNCISSFARINSADGLRRAIFMNGPCLVTLPLYHSGAEFWRKNGPHTGNVKYHSCAAIGWTKTGFILHNTWGAKWNGGGETILPFQDWGDVLECWTGFSATKITSGRKRNSRILSPGDRKSANLSLKPISPVTSRRDDKNKGDLDGPLSGGARKSGDRNSCLVQ